MYPIKKSKASFQLYENVDGKEVVVTVQVDYNKKEYSIIPNYAEKGNNFNFSSRFCNTKLWRAVGRLIAAAAEHGDSEINGESQLDKDW